MYNVFSAVDNFILTITWNWKVIFISENVLVNDCFNSLKCSTNQEGNHVIFYDGKQKMFGLWEGLHIAKWVRMLGAILFSL